MRRRGLWGLSPGLRIMEGSRFRASGFGVQGFDFKGLIFRG